MEKPQLLKMQQLVQCLSQGFEGTSECLAETIQVSRSTLFRYLDDLRDYGAEIEYCKASKTFSMKNDFNFLHNYFRVS